MSSAELQLVDASELDFEGFAQLQRTAFAEILRQNRVSDAYLNADFFRWKYHSSVGPAKIALIYEGSEMVAANAMMRYRLKMSTGFIEAWQSCDTASLPSARGRGYFKKCLHGLLTQIAPDEVFFGFPNANSRKGFLGIGWREYSLLSTFVKPWFFSPWRSLGGVEVSPYGLPQLEPFLQEWMRDRNSLVVRDRAYLEWRYFARPERPYLAFYQWNRHTLEAVALGRLAEVKGRKVVLVMEAMGLRPRAERSIREAVARWGFGQGASLAVDINSHLTPWNGLLGGFCPVPQALLPKRNVFMGQAQDPLLAEALKCPWYLSVGDWDGF